MAQKTPERGFSVDFFLEKREYRRRYPSSMPPKPSRKSSYMPSEQEKNILDHVRTRFSAMESARSRVDKEWEDNENAFIAPFRSNDQYESDINVPVEWSHVQHAMSEVMDSPPSVIFQPKRSSALEKIELNQAIWDFAWEKADTDAQMHDFYLSAFVNGSAVWYEGYQVTGRKSYKKIGLTKEDLDNFDLPHEYLTEDANFVEEDVIEYDDVYGECVPLKEFFIDDRAKVFYEPTHSKDAIDCARRRFFTPTAFHQAFSKYPRRELVKGLVADNDSYENNTERERKSPKANKIKVIEYWSRETQSYVIMVNDEVILNGDGLGEKFPFDHGRLPFAVAVCFKVPGSPWGLGLVALLRGLRAQQNLLFNIGADQGKNATQPPLLKGSGMEILDEEWYAGMGYILNVNGSLEDIRELPVGQLANDFFSLLDRLEIYEVLATGADVRSLVKSEPTAFQQANKKEISLKRLKTILQFIHWDGLKQMADLRWANIRTMYSIEDVEAISGQDANGDGSVERPAGRQIRIKNKQVLEELDEKGAVKGISFLPADGRTDFFTLDPKDIEDYDFTIEFKLNTSKELKKLRFQEAINVLPVILKVIEVDLFNAMEMLEIWADVYELPQKILNKQTDAQSQQRKLGVPPPAPQEAPPQQMAPQGGFDPAGAFDGMVQNGFNIAQ